MKRKSPKNQRPYSSPSGKKSVLVQVTGDDLDLLLTMQEDIGSPRLFRNDDATKFYAYANAMRKWRASQPTSSAEQT